eukprot:7666-Eustigmatos_ZCMA.PRE.1
MHPHNKPSRLSGHCKSEINYTSMVRKQHDLSSESRSSAALAVSGTPDCKVHRSSTASAP